MVLCLYTKLNNKCQEKIMGNLDLHKAIADVIGAGDKYVVMTEFFKTAPCRDIFSVVKDIAANAFYVFYDEDSTICHKFIGKGDALSTFIADAYGIKFHISTSKNWSKQLVTYDHIQAKDYAMDSIRYGHAIIQ